MVPGIVHRDPGRRAHSGEPRRDADADADVAVDMAVDMAAGRLHHHGHGRGSGNGTKNSVVTGRRLGGPSPRWKGKPAIGP
ncbi:hypothetical protein GCM10017559_22250 [Streptosporangium longisporum]|uniref:Uncharacterized protein n=1 Tax=Streptosporangium longisporum TaxID=46187 RepID=A0ABN3XVJ7_9ACTN